MNNKLNWKKRIDIFIPKYGSPVSYQSKSPKIIQNFQNIQNIQKDEIILEELGNQEEDNENCTPLNILNIQIYNKGGKIFTPRPSKIVKSKFNFQKTDSPFSPLKIKKRTSLQKKFGQDFNYNYKYIAQILREKVKKFAQVILGKNHKTIKDESKVIEDKDEDEDENLQSAKKKQTPINLSDNSQLNFKMNCRYINGHLPAHYDSFYKYDSNRKNQLKTNTRLNKISNSISLSKSIQHFSNLRIKKVRNFNFLIANALNPDNEYEYKDENSIQISNLPQLSSLSGKKFIVSSSMERNESILKNAYYKN